MPWHIGRSSQCPSTKPVAVIKDNDGSVAGCHKSRAAAQRQLAALNAAENKESAGEWRWLAIASNPFEDRGPEHQTVSVGAQEKFIELVDSGMVDYPELWHWHVYGTAWGKADIVFLLDGFLIVAGYVYQGHEQEAEILSQMDNLAVSTASPYTTMLSSEDGVVEAHVIREISVLPYWNVANQLTDVVIYQHGRL